MQFLQDLMAAPKEDQAGYEARKRLQEYPLNFVPTSVEIRSIIKAIHAGADTQQGLLLLLGFKPLPEIEKDKDFQEWMAQELGYGQTHPVQ